MVAATAPTTFANSAMVDAFASSSGALTSAALGRAVLFIDECAHLPITVTEIADATGVTPGSLRCGFARYLGTTPAAYLRRVRLQRAHLDLGDVDPLAGTTVAAIAGK